jgi:hypothetical protein
MMTLMMMMRTMINNQSSNYSNHKLIKINYQYKIFKIIKYSITYKKILKYLSFKNIKISPTISLKMDGFKILILIL